MFTVSVCSRGKLKLSLFLCLLASSVAMVKKLSLDKLMEVTSCTSRVCVCVCVCGGGGGGGGGGGDFAPNNFYH